MSKTVKHFSIQLKSGIYSEVFNMEIFAHLRSTLRTLTRTYACQTLHVNCCYTHSYTYTHTHIQIHPINKNRHKHSYVLLPLPEMP